MNHIVSTGGPMSGAKRKGVALGVAAALVMAFGGAMAGASTVSAADGLNDAGVSVSQESAHSSVMSLRTIRWE